MKHNKERNVNTMCSELGAKRGESGAGQSRTSLQPLQQQPNRGKTHMQHAAEWSSTVRREKNNTKQTLAFYLYPR